jgi:hypothetical protein
MLAIYPGPARALPLEGIVSERERFSTYEISLTLEQVSPSSSLSLTRCLPFLSLGHRSELFQCNLSHGASPMQSRTDPRGDWS